MTGSLRESPKKRLARVTDKFNLQIVDKLSTRITHFLSDDKNLHEPSSETYILNTTSKRHVSPAELHIRSCHSTQIQPRVFTLSNLDSPSRKRSNRRHRLLCGLSTREVIMDALDTHYK